MLSRTIAVTAVATLLSASAVLAHEHAEDNIEPGNAMSEDPIDSTLWLHIILQAATWGLIFPAGMVLGITRSRLHVPVQVLGTVLSILGYFLGHAHKGRQFTKNIHASFASSLMLMLVVQVGLGIYLKLHLKKAYQNKIRPYAVLLHGIVGKVMPVVSWVQMVFGGLTTLGFCRGDHLGQCLAHFIMGSAFIAYGIMLTILLLVGQFWLRKTGRSQEFFDSLVIAVWGCINTFTEHRWGGPWVANDLQHTSMGIVWWCAGLVGIWLSRKRDGRPKRNIIPAIVIFMTGWAMGSHPQHLMISTMVHTMFGYTLMAAGLARIIEISFVLKDHADYSSTDPHSFQYVTPYLLYAAGFLFMGATEEQMELLAAANVTHVSYILILYSIAFILFLFVNVLLHIYARHAWPETFRPKPHRSDSANAESRSRGRSRPKLLTRRTSSMNGSGMLNGNANGGADHPRSYADAQQIHDAETFELEGLMSDDDAEEIKDVEAGGLLAGQR